MSRKFDESRRRAFLDVLAETGNQTIAAERAKVSRSWVRLHRSGDPAFKAAIVEATEKARRSFDKLRTDGGGTAPPSGWGSLDGADLVVRGTNGRRVQIARSRLKQWCPRTEERFLATLAATCNVKAACAEVGLTQVSAYEHRKRWPAFARRWDEAIEEGYVRLEIGLVENGCNIFSSPELPPEAPMPPMSVEQAIHLLHMHKKQVRGIGKRPGRWRYEPRTLDEVRDSILRKLNAIKAARALSEEERAADEREWAGRRPANG